MRAGAFGLAMMMLGLGGGVAVAKAPPPKKEEPKKEEPKAPPPPAGPKATAEVKDATGKVLGTVTLEQGGAGLLITGELSGLPAGDHALHLHETGKCEAPGFKTAGGHFNPAGKKHGIKHADGMHAGDLPNLHVGADGKVKFDVVAAGVSLDKDPKLVDADGAAVVLHAKADDYSGDPAGNAGDRIACGVVTLAK